MARSVSFDVDGVIAGGDWIPEWDRKPEIYSELPVLDPMISGYLESLMYNFNLYFVSARSYVGATYNTRRWLINNCDLPKRAISGVICAEEYTSRKERKAFKIDVIRALNPIIHMDDEPEILEALRPDQRVWFRQADNHWPNPDEIEKRCRFVAESWNELGVFFEELCRGRLS